MKEIIQALKILSSKWQAIKSQGGTLDVDVVMEEIARVSQLTDATLQDDHDRLNGDLTTMGGIGPQRKVRIDLFTEGGKLKARVASVDRENKKHEAMLPDGTWVEVSLYSDHPESLFNISETRTQQIVKELSP